MYQWIILVSRLLIYNSLTNCKCVDKLLSYCCNISEHIIKECTGSACMSLHFQHAEWCQSYKQLILNMYRELDLVMAVCLGSMLN
jgi:hypothetical protein